MGDQDRDVLYRVGVAAHPETSAVLDELGREVVAAQERIQHSMAAVAENAIQQIRRVRSEALAPTGFVPAPVAMPAGRSVDVSPTVMTAVAPTATEARQQIGNQLFGHGSADALMDASRRAIDEVRESVRAMRELQTDLASAVRELRSGVTAIRNWAETGGSKTSLPPSSDTGAEPGTSRFRAQEESLTGKLPAPPVWPGARKSWQRSVEESLTGRLPDPQAPPSRADYLAMEQSLSGRLPAPPPAPGQRSVFQQEEDEFTGKLPVPPPPPDERSVYRRAEESLTGMLPPPNAPPAPVGIKPMHVVVDNIPLPVRIVADGSQADSGGGRGPGTGPTTPDEDERGGAPASRGRRSASRRSPPARGSRTSDAERAARQRQADQEFLKRYDRSQDIKTVQKYETAKRQAQSFRRMQNVYGKRSSAMFRGAFRGGVQMARGLGLAGLSEKEGGDAQKLLQDLMKLQAVVDVVMGAQRIFETVGRGFEFLARKSEMAKKADEAAQTERELAPEAKIAGQKLKDADAEAAAETLRRVQAARARVASAVPPKAGPGGVPLTPFGDPDLELPAPPAVPEGKSVFQEAEDRLKGMLPSPPPAPGGKSAFQEAEDALSGRLPSPPLPPDPRSVFQQAEDSFAGMLPGPVGPPGKRLTPTEVEKSLTGKFKPAPTPFAMPAVDELDEEELLASISRKGVSMLDLAKAASMERKAPVDGDGPPDDDIVDAELANQADKAKEAISEKLSDVKEKVFGKLSDSLMSGADSLASKLGLSGVGTASVGTLIGSGLGAVAGVVAAATSAVLTSQQASKYGLGGGAEHGSLVDKVATWEVEAASALARVLDKVGVDFKDVGTAADVAVAPLTAAMNALEQMGVVSDKTKFSFTALAEEIDKVNEGAEMAERLTERLKERREEEARDLQLVAIESGERRQMAGAEDRARTMRQQWEDILRPTPDYGAQLQQFDWEASQRDVERRRAIRFREPGAMTAAEADRAALEDRMKRLQLQEEQRQERFAPQRERAQTNLEDAQKRLDEARKRVAAIGDSVKETNRTTEELAVSDAKVAELDREIAAREKDSQTNVGRFKRTRLGRWALRTFGGIDQEQEDKSLEDLKEARRQELSAPPPSDRRAAWEKERDEAIKDQAEAEKQLNDAAMERVKVEKMDREEARAFFKEKIATAEKAVEQAQKETDAAKERILAERERIGGMHYSQRARLSVLMERFNEAADKGLSDDEKQRFEELRKKKTEGGIESLTDAELAEIQQLRKKREQSAAENMAEHERKALGGLTNDASVQEAVRLGNRAAGEGFSRLGIGESEAETAEAQRRNELAARAKREEAVAEREADERRRATTETEAVGQALGQATEQQLKVLLENPKFQVTLDADIDNTAKQVAFQVMTLIRDYENNLKTLVAQEVKKQKTDLANQNNQGKGGEMAGKGG